MERLSKYCKIISGYAFKSNDLKDYGDVAVVKISNISNGADLKIDENTQFVNSDFLSINKKYHINFKDVLISLTGSHMNQPNSMVGRSCRSYKKYTCLLNQRAGKILPTNEANLNFLYYLFQTNEIKNSIVARAFGAANQANVSPKDIENIKWNFPKLEFQNKIASILSAYDDLIEVNNKKIKTLNEMAQEIYKEWFVRFRFPGHEKVEFQNSILGSIPQDFKILKINDVLDDFIGGGWGEDDESSAFNTDAFVIRGTDFKNIENGILDSCPYRWHKASNFKSRQLKENDFILEISGGTAEQPVGRAIIVEKEILDRFDNKVICASFCKLLRIKNEKIAPFYFYYWLKYLYETKIIEQFQLQSTGIINFKFDYFLRKCNVLLPPKNILDNFEKIVKPIRDKIQKLGFENDKLIKQRDLLLPRLMSGKLEVKG